MVTLRGLASQIYLTLNLQLGSTDGQCVGRSIEAPCLDIAPGRTTLHHTIAAEFEGLAGLLLAILIREFDTFQVPSSSLAVISPVEQLHNAQASRQAIRCYPTE